MPKPAADDDVATVPEALRAAHAAIKAEAVALAGSADALEHRAAQYLRMYRHSGGNFAFAVLAAHGALWGRGFFRLGTLVGSVLAWLQSANAGERARLRAELETLASGLREINRHVFVEAYTVYHFTDRHGREEGATAFVDAALLARLNRSHAARRNGIFLPDADKRALFEAMYRFEQAGGVADMVDAAVARFHWPLALAFAMRPRIAFAYMPVWRQPQFRNFASVDERTMRGLQAFDLAAKAGWDRTEAALQDYPQAHLAALPRVASAIAMA